MKPTMYSKNYPPNQLLDEFFEKLRSAPHRYLLVDYDGTLAPFNIDLNKAFPYLGVRERLDAIMDDPRNHVVIISGRWTRDLLPLLALRRQPELWGSYGWEQIKPDGEYSIERFDEAALQALAEVDNWSEAITERGGRCEQKPGCLAVHWRGLAQKQKQALQRYIEERWQEQSPHPGLGWHEFDGGIELRIFGRTKGSVIERILGEMPEDAIAAFLGDDISDEDAFHALHGHGLTVIVRSCYRETSAEVWLRPPGGLLAFLDRWLQA